MSRAPTVSAASAALSPIGATGTDVSTAEVGTQHLPPGVPNGEPLIDPLAQMLTLLERVAVGMETLGNRWETA